MSIFDKPVSSAGIKMMKNLIGFWRGKELPVWFGKAVENMTEEELEEYKKVSKEMQLYFDSHE